MPVCPKALFNEPAVRSAPSSLSSPDWVPQAVVVCSLARRRWVHLPVACALLPLQLLLRCESAPTAWPPHVSWASTVWTLHGALFSLSSAYWLSTRWSTGQLLRSCAGFLGTFGLGSVGLGICSGACDCRPCAAAGGAGFLRMQRLLLPPPSHGSELHTVSQPAPKGRTATIKELLSLHS